MFSPKLGVSLHMISKDVTPELLGALSDSHIVTAELSLPVFGESVRDEKIIALKKRLKTTGIRVMTIHSPFSNQCDISNPDKKIQKNTMAKMISAIDFAVEFEAPIIVVHPSAEPILPNERRQRMDQARGALDAIGRKCEKNGKKIAIEYLPRTCLGNNVNELLAILDGFEKAKFGICLDVNHLMERYVELPDFVHKLGKSLFTTHLSDYDGVDEKHWTPGKGVINWKDFMQSLHDIDYNGPFNYESHLEGDNPAEKIKNLEENFKWLSSI
jgi:sugar phosphate isomerase/epimerase